MIPAAHAPVLELSDHPFPAGWSHQTCAALTLVPPERFLHLWLQSNTASVGMMLSVPLTAAGSLLTRLFIWGDTAVDPSLEESRPQISYSNI